MNQQATVTQSDPLLAELINPIKWEDYDPHSRASSAHISASYRFNFDWDGWELAHPPDQIDESADDVIKVNLGGTDYWEFNKTGARIVAVDGQEVIGFTDGAKETEKLKYNIGETINIEPIEKPEYADFEKYRHSYIVQTITDIEGYDQALTRWETYKWKIV